MTTTGQVDGLVGVVAAAEPEVGARRRKGRAGGQVVEGHRQYAVCLECDHPRMNAAGAVLHREVHDAVVWMCDVWRM